MPLQRPLNLEALRSFIGHVNMLRHVKDWDPAWLRAPSVVTTRDFHMNYVNRML